MSIQYSRERTLLYDFVEEKTKQKTKHFGVGLYSDIYRPIKTIKLYIMILVWITLTFFKVTVE